MADKSIQFSVPMVKRLIHGAKTQTRRLDRPAGNPYQVGDRLYVREPWRVARRYDGYSPVSSRRDGPILTPRAMSVLYIAGGQAANMEGGGWTFDWHNPRHMPDWAGKFRQAMHMPRWASRLTLTVTDVRIERLHDISYEDCIAEGIEMESADPPFYYVPGMDTAKIAVGIEQPGGRHAQRAYFNLLDFLHGDGFSARNPKLVAYSFTVERGNIDMLSEAA